MSLIVDDTDVAAYFGARGLHFVHVARAPRCRIVFDDDPHRANDLLREYNRDHLLHAVFYFKKRYLRAIALAKASPAGVCTSADLEAHFARRTR